jgi:hypothetical protein
MQTLKTFFLITVKMTVAITLILALSSCTVANCKPDTSQPGVLSNDVQARVDDLKKDSNLKTVKVFKLDGSLQCNQGSPISLETMKSELSGVKIITSEKRNDGMMRIQVCGQPTGQCNIFEIAESDLEAAKAKGFKIWKQN